MEFLIDNQAPILILGINLATTVSYFVIYSNIRLKTFFYKLPMLVQKMYVAFFVVPLFVSPFLSQTRFAAGNIYLLLIGILIAAVGFTFIVLSFLRIGVIPSIKGQNG